MPPLPALPTAGRDRALVHRVWRSLRSASAAIKVARIIGRRDAPWRSIFAVLAMENEAVDLRKFPQVQFS